MISFLNFDLIKEPGIMMVTNVDEPSNYGVVVVLKPTSSRASWRNPVYVQ
jgi:hypothetical protein